MSQNRSQAIDVFLDNSGWAGAQRKSLAGDASFRRYERIRQDNKDDVVLMDAPPPQEDVRPFVAIARHLTQLGLSAPKILAEDADLGFLLLEDLGDDTYTRLLSKGHNETDLYELATDVLVHLHKFPVVDVTPPGVGPYAKDRLIEEVDRLNTWYLPLISAPELSSTAREDYVDIWTALLPQAWRMPDSLILFDYHVDNLLLLENRAGVKACGLLDFQDAVIGPVTYDLMSLLEDARRDIDPELVAAMKERYCSAFPNLGRENFDASWAVMAAQRHLRVIGTFARLKLRDGKPQYLEHMPRLWCYMDACLQHPVLEPLKQWLDHHVPSPLRVIPE